LTNEEEFLTTVDRWIGASLRAGNQQFSRLLGSLPSVDPTVVVERLRALGSYASVHFDACPAESVCFSDLRLPIPHPLDFDWRFHSQTASQLSDALAAYARPVLLLGAPSVFLALADKKFSRNVRLIDSNPRMVGTQFQSPAHFAFDSADAFRWSCDAPSAVTVFADPPWYPRALEAFLWCAAAATLQGSVVMLSVPQVGTRPGVAEERLRLIAYARSIGLALSELREGVMTYVTPPFEANAFRAAGLGRTVPSNWRSGDLMVFQREAFALGARPTARTSDDEPWATFERGGVIIRVKEQADEGDDPRLVSIVAGDILATVSRRDARRVNARVWTSGNRIFGCSAPATLRRVLAGELVRSDTVDEALEMIRRVVETEQAEYTWSRTDDRTTLGAGATPTGRGSAAEDTRVEG